MTSAEAIVAAQVAAYNAQDIDAFLACFHEDVEFIGWPDQIELRGRAAFRPRYAALWASSPRLEARIVNRIALGRFVVDLEELHFHVDGDRPPMVVLYEVEGALIRRFRVIRQETRESTR